MAGDWIRPLDSIRNLKNRLSDFICSTWFRVGLILGLGEVLHGRVATMFANVDPGHHVTFEVEALVHMSPLFD